jgi:TonB family protein
VNYKEAVAAIYERAWQTPTDATDDKSLTTASVTIARDGTVISARIKTPSGDAATDRSVEQTLRRVKFVAPFPEGATDMERTFIIKFDLKKRLLG